MVDKRSVWETKTFWGAVGYAALIVLSALGVQLPYEPLLNVVHVWTGYSVADRFRSK